MEIYDKIEQKIASYETGRVFEADKLYGNRAEQRGKAEQIIEILNADVDMKTVINVFEEFNLTGNNLDYVRRYVTRYSKRGVAFWDATAMLVQKDQKKQELERS